MRLPQSTDPRVVRCSYDLRPNDDDCRSVPKSPGVSGAVTAVLFILADFWKPFFAAYLGKRGNGSRTPRILRRF